jgi:hypothetical protein
MPSLVLEVLKHCGLHGASRDVYVALASYVEQYGNGVFPSLITLAQDADISERHLQRCLKKLAKNGYLRITQRKEPGKQMRNVYTLSFPWRLPAHKSTDNPAHKSTDISCPSKDLKTQDKKKEKDPDPVTRLSPVTPVDPSVAAYHVTTTQLMWLGLRPGTEVYALCLNGSQTHEGP